MQLSNPAVRNAAELPAGVVASDGNNNNEELEQQQCPERVDGEHGQKCEARLVTAGDDDEEPSTEMMNVVRVCDSSGSAAEHPVSEQRRHHQQNKQGKKRNKQLIRRVWILKGSNRGQLTRGLALTDSKQQRGKKNKKIHGDQMNHRDSKQVLDDQEPVGEQHQGERVEADSTHHQQGKIHGFISMIELGHNKSRQSVDYVQGNQIIPNRS